MIIYTDKTRTLRRDPNIDFFLHVWWVGTY